MNRPKLEFVPKTLADLHVEGGLSDHMNGGNFSLHGKTHFTDTPHTARWHSGGLAVSNCSLFSLFLCHADVYVSLRGSTLTDIHIASVSYIPPPSAKLSNVKFFLTLWSHAQTYYPRLSKYRLFNFISWNFVSSFFLAIWIKRYILIIFYELDIKSRCKFSLNG